MNNLQVSRCGTRMLKALIKSLENKHLTGLLPENTDFKGRVEGSYMKLISSLPGCEALPLGRTPAFKGGTLQSLTPGILVPSSPTKLEKKHKPLGFAKLQVRALLCGFASVY